MEENIQGNNKMKHILAVILLSGAILLGLVSLVRERIVNPSQYTASFTGEGRVFAKPDIAQIQLAVRTDRAKDAVTAVKNNTDKINSVIKKLKDLEIEEKDIKTTAYQLNPEYDYPANVGRQVLAGYSVYQEVTVKIRNLDNVGRVIEQVTSVGVNQITGPTFTIDDLSEVHKQAREEAIAKAKEQANSTANMSGLRLGKLVGVYEETSRGGMPPVYYAKAMDSAIGMGGESAFPAPEIQTGENEVILRVTLTYQIK
ncbi:MAG: SIMPL domain-containing protein [Candidatus Komeilibacteria bacterium]|nr:SIMPL domain-containing protein [Candidatus Komeilibacteria bacterium]